MSTPSVLTASQRSLIERARVSLRDLAHVPLPGSGSTWERWEQLIRLGYADLSCARLLEGHLDAMAILAELGRPDLIERGGLWGVWAAEPGRLEAGTVERGWRLHGAKGWCSGADGLDCALVTATDRDGPRLFVVAADEVGFDASSWTPMGMEATASYTAKFDLLVDEPAAIGSVGDYTARPGFGHGGAGVAAVWLGGALGLFDRLADGDRTKVARERELGALRAQLESATSHLRWVARVFDREPRDAAVAERWAASVRLVVEGVGRSALELALRSIGAEGLCHQSELHGRVADLAVYLSQLRADQAAVAYFNMRAPSS